MPSWPWTSSVAFCSTCSSGTISISTLIPVSAVNSSLAIWLATIVGGVASEVKRIVVPLNWPPTSLSQFLTSSGVWAAARSVPTLVRPPKGRPWPRKVVAKPEKPMPASAIRRRNSRLPIRAR